jgi:hypothetical protein
MSPHKLQPAEDTTEDRKPSLKNPQDNPCWSGYHPVGTKKKNGQTVPNCVPKESINEETTADKISAALTAKGITYSRAKEEEIINMIGDEMKRQGMSGKNIRYLMSYDQDFIPDVLAGLARDVTAGFKNNYNVGDRVESPLGTGTITVVSKNVNVDGRVKVKLDDPDRAGEDGKHKDTFVFTTDQLKHVAEQGMAEGSEQVAEARRPTDFATITIENPDDTGDIDLEVGYHTEGDYYPATRPEPASHPEIIIDSVRRTDTGAEILSTLDDGTYEYILNRLYDRQDQDQFESVNEISDKTKASYQKQAQKQVQDLMPHARTGEYRDMAKNIINKREQGLARLGTVAENMLADYARNLDSISETEDGISVGDLDEQGVTEGMESLGSLIGKRVYVKSVGEMGTVSDVSMGHRNSLIVNLDNGDREIAHFTDLSQERPGMMRRMMDKIKSPVAATAPLKERTEANNSDADVAELRRLAGLK